jgi:hypothetical protein
MWSRHSRRSVPTNLSANEFTRGARTGILITRVPFPLKTPSNAAVNLQSRSRIMNMNRPARSPRSRRRLRACWVVQAPVGCAVTPRMCTARVWISITTSTYKRRSATVSTCRKSHAKMPDACAIRNCRHVGDARRGAGPSPPAARKRTAPGERGRPSVPDDCRRCYRPGPRRTRALRWPRALRRGRPRPNAPGRHRSSWPVA